jgi:hypothetical protein
MGLSGQRENVAMQCARAESIRILLRINFIPVRFRCLQDVLVGHVVDVRFLASDELNVSLRVPTVCLSQF